MLSEKAREELRVELMVLETSIARLRERANAINSLLYSATEREWAQRAAQPETRGEESDVKP